MPPNDNVETETENVKKTLGSSKKGTKTELEQQKAADEKDFNFFQWLGKFVTKNYKIILIISLLSAVSAIVPAIKLSGELKYNDQDFLPSNLESKRGYEILDEQFPSNISRESTLLVINSENPITSEQNLAYLQEITKRINQSYFSDDIGQINNLWTVYLQYNQTYWEGMRSTEAELQTMLENNITYIHQQLYDNIESLTTMGGTLSSLHTTNWFNFSRTYFYGLYDSSLFSTGPNTTIYQSITQNTNFTQGWAITNPFVDLVYQTINNSLGNPMFVNDQVIHQLVNPLVNASLKQYLMTQYNMTQMEYLQTINPLLEAYQQNWATTFQSMVTNQGISIVNGTHLSANNYSLGTYPEKYNSQAQVFSTLQAINATSFPTLEPLIPTIVKSQIKNTLSSYPTITEYLNSSQIASFVDQIYLLGSTPTSQEIQILASVITDEIMNQIIAENPPFDSVTDLPVVTTMWVLSTDQKTALVSVTYEVLDDYPEDEEERGLKLREYDDWIGEMAHNLINKMELEETEVYRSGEIYITQSISRFSEEAASKVDIIAVVFVIVILILIFTSLIAPMVPLATIGVSIAISFALLFWVAQAMDIHYLSTLILTIVSMGAGVDYCIFIYSRYHEELEKGKEKKEAVEIAVEHAGESVFHSGLTVLIGFGSLIIPNFPMLRCMGISMLIGMSFSILCSMLIVPSLLMLLGDLVFWPRGLHRILRPNLWFKGKDSSKEEEENEELSTNNSIQEKVNENEKVPEGTSAIKKRQKGINEASDNKKPEKESLTLRFGRFVTNNGLIFFIISLVIFAPFVYFAATMDTSTDFINLMPDDFEGGEASELLEGSMLFGEPVPVRLLFYNTTNHPLTHESLFQTDQLCIQLLNIEEIETIRTTVRPLGLFAIPYSNQEALGYYQETMQSFVGKDNHTLQLELYLTIDPYSDQAQDLVKSLPETIDTIIHNKDLTLLSDSHCYVLGVSQDFYEMNQVTENAYPIVIPVVIVGVYLVLFFLFGSYFTPIRLIFTIGMSVIFSLAMLSLIYGYGFNAPLFWLLPMLLFSILTGLGLDYDIFLVTRVKEYCQAGMTDKEAIVHALEHTGTIITSCGLVMAAAFSSLMFSNLWHISELGFAFTLSILLDATFVRLVLVPSIMVLLEKWNWSGPKFLRKVYRNPLIVSVMKDLSDQYGIEIYKRDFKEDLEAQLSTTLEENGKDVEEIYLSLHGVIKKYHPDWEISSSLETTIKDTIQKSSIEKKATT
jgi:uncharacterized membrane protein YdfJ with MMPL/SSD domain